MLLKGSGNTCLFIEYKQLIAPKELEQIYVIMSRINTSTTEQNVTV